MNRWLESILCSVLLVAVAGCTTGPSAGSASGMQTPTLSGDPTGSVSLAFTIPGEVTLNQVSYVVTGPTNLSNTVDVSQAQSAIGFVVGPLSAASGYTIALSATDTVGDPCASAAVPFDVNVGAITQVTVNLVCDTPPSPTIVVADAGSGSVAVNVTVSVDGGEAGAPIVCPTIAGISVSPAEEIVGASSTVTVVTAPPGASVTYSVVAVDPGGSGSGTVASTATGAVFTCNSPGQVRLTVVTTAPGCTDESLSTLITCEPIDAGDAGPVDDANPCPDLEVTPTGAFDGTTLSTLHGVTRINGNLTISGTNVVTLQDLQCLVAVSGSVSITSTTLGTLSGLDSLGSIGGSLYVASNPSLTSASDLSALQTVAGAIGFESDQGLTNVALPALTSVGTSGLPDGFNGSVVFNVLASLTNIDVHSLPTTPSNVQFTTIGSQAAGPLATNFASLTTVNGSLNFASVANLDTMAGLGALTTVRGSFTLNGLASLQNVGGLGALATVGAPGVVASVYIASNPALTDVTLAGLQTVTGAIGFESDQALTDAALPALTSVGTSGLPDGFNGSVVFNVLASLTKIDFRSLPTTPSNVQFTTIGSQAAGPLATNFASLTTVNGSLNFASVANLDNMAGLGALATVRGSFTLNGLASL
ncbi:MAG TPA: hypothetical protein VGL81_04585, partial [Polyangiaceae bacterium]